MLEWILGAAFGAVASVAAAGPLRERLLALIDERPGQHASSICRSTGSPWSTVQYQLDLLARSDMVTAVETGRTKRFFPAGMDQHQIQLLAILHEGRREHVARLIQQRPGIRQVDICASIDMSRKTFRRAVEPLIDQGLIQERRGLQDNRYFAAPELADLLEPGEGGSADASSDLALGRP